jgi:hypothetical protein
LALPTTTILGGRALTSIAPGGEDGRAADGIDGSRARCKNFGQ